MLELIKIYGIVQGVGFRPFVSRLADSLGLKGTVCNKGSYVEVVAEGEKAILADFCRRLTEEAPERAVIMRLDREKVTAAKTFCAFDIVESQKEGGSAFVSPDIATCDACAQELFDKENPRYLHPFINCTACGPRLTIMESLPYDRERTSMADFPLCDFCRREYFNPTSRRYDAQPVCCPNCGPEVYILFNRSECSALGLPNIRGGEAIKFVRRIILDGGIVAIKGIGGFHLCCDATNEGTVRRLRELKHRPAKPFAVMMRDLAAVKEECETFPLAEKFLTGHQKPIVLLSKIKGGRIAPGAAPDSPVLGVMLPYAPIHYLLFNYPDGLTMPKALIMTSGNTAGAPICHTDEEALESLTPLCDAALSHNRRIRLRSDDTVLDFLDHRPYMIRRSRGFAPLPLKVPGDFSGQVLALGGELKNSFCLAKDNLFYISPYIGDMTDLRGVMALEDSLNLLQILLEVKPEQVAADPHPRYHTKALAEKFSPNPFFVQHHYAHILSCLAENDYLAPVIGLALDGTGYGEDGTVWGGEILWVTPEKFRRLGHIEPFKQVGGDRTAREGWRIALSLLDETFSSEEVVAIAARRKLCTVEELKGHRLMAKNNLNTVISTSAGRLFDAVSALFGLCRLSTFEGEAAMKLEYAAARYTTDGRITRFRIPKQLCQIKTDAKDGFLLPTHDLFRYLTQEFLAGRSAEELAYLFHAALAGELVAAAEAAQKATDLKTVALSGGVWQNKLLTSLTAERLETKGFKVLLHSLVPPNDGGICLGQALAAMVALSRR